MSKVTPKAAPKNAYTLRETAAELGRSEIWIRRQLRKQIGELGAAGFKDDGCWRVPAEVVAAEKDRLAKKDTRSAARARGEIKSQYTPDKVKAAAIVKEEIGKLGLSPETEAELRKAMAAMVKRETEAWQKRQAKRNSK